MRPHLIKSGLFEVLFSASSFTCTIQELKSSFWIVLSDQLLQLLYHDFVRRVYSVCASVLEFLSEYPMKVEGIYVQPEFSIDTASCDIVRFRRIIGSHMLLIKGVY